MLKGKKQNGLRLVLLAALLLGVPAAYLSDRSANGNSAQETIMAAYNNKSGLGSNETLKMSGPFGLKVLQVSPAAFQSAQTGEDYVRPYEGSPAYRLLNKMVRDELRRERPSTALKLLNQDPLSRKIKNSEYDRLRTSIAQSYLAEGKLQDAYRLAQAAMQRSNKDLPLSGWVYGLAAYRLHDMGEAEKGFSTAAMAKSSSPWLRAASAYWAFRAAKSEGKTAAAKLYLDMAAEHPRTFYGLVALKSLGRDIDLNWSKPRLSHNEKAGLEKSPAVQEALRLSKKGNIVEASTLLGKNAWLSGDKREKLLAYVLENDAPALALHLAKNTKDRRGGYYDLALYPESPWKVTKDIDKALVNALIRQESRFNPKAVSASGARGLMQLMPTTASFIGKSETLQLSDPRTNINVGQKYIRHLLADPSVNNDLFAFTVAYNAGPGNLARWKRQLKDIDDPLLFIESIPSAETRNFVERVMMNYWIYRMRNGETTPSLDAVAQSLDEDYVDTGAKPFEVAAN